MSDTVRIEVGVKSDPIEYRYSYAWLFRIMADMGVRHLQIGSFFEVYQLADGWFHDLRRLADDHGIAITSLFTAHRELGGFFRCDPYWESVARRNYARYIEVGGLLGAKNVGSNPGATLRDEMHRKDEGVACYLRHMTKLMAYAQGKGVECLTAEPMSCLGEPPTLPEEIRHFSETLLAHHRAHPDTATAGICADTSHGYADENGVIRYTHMALFEACLPYLAEFHVKNTDAMFHSTFGFSPSERARGIVDLAAVRDLIQANAALVPRRTVVAYLEIGGPKLGRDYSDNKLEAALRDSLEHVLDVFAG
jgi:ribulose-phosphate 3-epimerase